MYRDLFEKKSSFYLFFVHEKGTLLFYVSPRSVSSVCICSHQIISRFLRKNNPDLFLCTHSAVQAYGAQVGGDCQQPNHQKATTVFFTKVLDYVLVRTLHALSPNVHLGHVTFRNRTISTSTTSRSRPRGFVTQHSRSITQSFFAFYRLFAFSVTSRRSRISLFISQVWNPRSRKKADCWLIQSVLETEPRDPTQETTRSRCRVLNRPP
jgi:hypothetical protein